MDEVLLDTDILSEVLKQKDPTVVQQAAAYLAQYAHFAFSAITYYEVIRGLKDKNATAQLQNFVTFCGHSIIVPVSKAVLDRTADLWVEGRKGGHPRRDADLVIAATALETGRNLVTGNTSDFRWIAGLTIENWRHSPKATRRTQCRVHRARHPVLN
jgi:tRNA(fMet)-specific endonuclease VapC